MTQLATKPPQTIADAEAVLTAAIYARVSSTGQMGRGDDDDGDGYSIRLRWRRANARPTAWGHAWRSDRTSSVPSQPAVTIGRCCRKC